MAQDVVVKESLSDATVRDGAALVQELDAGGWRPTAAFWFYFSDANAWRLLLASRDVAASGPREAYTSIQRALAQLDSHDRELLLEDIVVVAATDPLVGLLRRAITTGTTLARIRFSKNVIDGHFVDDALIYRLV